MNQEIGLRIQEVRKKKGLAEVIWRICQGFRLNLFFKLKSRALVFLLIR